jgi:mRNA-degrading endonuclease RelE of RelBE toxin-antitoxin system
MYKLIFRKSFDESFSSFKDKIVQKQIFKKIQQLKIRVPIGKKVKGYPYWSLRVGDFRIIYKINKSSSVVELLDILSRKRDYRELRKL